MPATLDLSVAQGAPVNRAIGPNLDVVLDDHSADLRNLAVILIKNVAEPVRADYCAGVNADALGQAASVVDADTLKAWARDWPSAELSPIVQCASRMASSPDCDVFPDYAIRANVGSLGDVGRVGDYRAWVNSGNKLFLGKEK